MILSFTEWLVFFAGTHKFSNQSSSVWQDRVRLGTSLNDRSGSVLLIYKTLLNYTINKVLLSAKYWNTAFPPTAINQILVQRLGAYFSSNMAPDFSCGEKSPVIFLRFEQDDVEFRDEQESPRDESAQDYANAHCDSLSTNLNYQLMQCFKTYFSASSKVDRKKRNPNNTSGIHGKSDKLGFIKIFRNVPRFKGIQSAQQN